MSEKEAGLGHNIARNAALVGISMLIGAGVINEIEHGKLFNFSPSISLGVKDPFPYQPPKAVGELQPQTVSLGQTHIVEGCNGEITAGVNVFAKQGIRFIDTSTIDHTWYSEAEICSNDNVVTTDDHLYGYLNHGHRVITKVVADVPPPLPINPGINMLNVDNCLNVTPGEKKAAITKAVNEFEKKKYTGSEPGCDFNYKLTAPFATDSGANIFGYSEMDAQAGFMLDPFTDKTIDSREPTLHKLFDAQLKGIYPGAQTIVDYEPLASVLSQEEQRIKLVAAQGAKVLRHIVFSEGKNGNHQQLEAEIAGPGGSDLVYNFVGHVFFNPGQIKTLNADAAHQLWLNEPKPGQPHQHHHGISK